MMFLRQWSIFGAPLLLSLIACSSADSLPDTTPSNADSAGENLGRAASQAAPVQGGAPGEDNFAARVPSEFLTRDHIEVSPGVFFLREVIESGKIKLLDAGAFSPDNGAARALKKTGPGPKPEDQKAPPPCVGLFCPVCIDCSDDDTDTFHANLAVPYPPFGLAGVGINDSLIITHSETICDGTPTYESTGIMVNLSTYDALPGAVLTLFSSFFVNGDYIGAVNTSIIGTNLSYSASFSATCLNGQIHVQAYPYHTFTISGSLASAGSSLDVDVDCGKCCN